MKEDTALLELIEKIEQLSQFQDRIDFPANIRQIWKVFLSDVRNLIETEICSLFLVDDDTLEFSLRYVSPENQRKQCVKELNSQIELGIFSWIIKRRQPALIPALAFDNEKSIVMLPLSTTKRTLGTVLVVTPIKESFITHEEIKLLTMLAKQYSLVIENTLLYERLKKEHKSLEKAHSEIRLLSRTDPLTGCYNRGYLNDHLSYEIKRAVRYRHHLSVALCDIDHFKHVNDNFGHQCGDAVLQEFVHSIIAVIRSDMDWLARYGGEEFMLVLPETSVSNAFRLAERLRKRISRKVILWQGESISITVSFGVTGFNAAKPFDKITTEEMIRLADKYLYQAKDEGRNRVVKGPITKGS
jgi:diguanylate cyclase (GGDEF)-like protein